MRHERLSSMLGGVLETYDSPRLRRSPYTYLHAGHTQGNGRAPGVNMQKIKADVLWISTSRAAAGKSV